MTSSHTGKLTSHLIVATPIQISTANSNTSIFIFLFYFPKQYPVNTNKIERSSNRARE